jgi:hypothetical protein
MILNAKEEYESAISVLKKAAMQLNADWRAAYRAFHLLSQLYKILGLAD